MNVTFITGNQNKADYLEKLLGLPIKHQKVDLEEIQSLDQQEIMQHKVHQAYKLVGEPVLVEDVSLEFEAMGRLPGTYIKSFVEELGYEELCRLVDGKGRGCVAKCTYGYYDGTVEKYWSGEHAGTIPEHPYDGEAFGWDVIYIPDGHTVTRAELNEEDNYETYLKIKPIEAVREFLQTQV